MTAECPSCRSSHTRVIDVRELVKGGRRRRIQCFTCNQRWTTYDSAPPKVGRAAHARKPGKRVPAMTADEVFLCLTSRATTTELSQQLGRSRQSITAVRRGDFHRDVHPHVPRWMVRRRIPPAVDRGDCLHWRDGCGLGFPDAIAEGKLFCSFCAAFANGSDADLIE